MVWDSLVQHDTFDDTTGIALARSLYATPPLAANSLASMMFRAVLFICDEANASSLSSDPKC